MCVNDNCLCIHNLRFDAFTLCFFIERLLLIANFVAKDAHLNHYCPQSSPTLSAGFSSKLPSTFEVISYSPPQSGQVIISPTTTSSGTLISAPHSWHSTFDFIFYLLFVFSIYRSICSQGVCHNRLQPPQLHKPFCKTLVKGRAGSVCCQIISV